MRYGVLLFCAALIGCGGGGGGATSDGDAGAQGGSPGASDDGGIGAEGGGASDGAIGADATPPDAAPVHGIFDVRAYGAKGDGAADDTPAFTKAIAAADAAGGGIVHVPAGEYRIRGSLAVA